MIQCKCSEIHNYEVPLMYKFRIKISYKNESAILEFDKIHKIESCYYRTLGMLEGRIFPIRVNEDEAIVTIEEIK